LVRRVAGHELHFDARGFFQGHAGLLDELVDRVVGPWTGETAFDLYGGVGLFALPLASRYARVTAVEGDRIAARLARRNARVARLDTIDVVAQAVDTWIVDGLPAGVDRVVVDPPRAGLGRAVRAALVARRPARVTYVSCHPAALARDLAELAYGFEVESLVLVDLFPQTGQIEVVAQLVARAVGAEPGA
jgi:23S rRNA (uracil1939-C5)-methyltransferase